MSKARDFLPRFWFGRDIRIFKKSPRCASYLRVKRLKSFFKTPRCASHCGVRLQGVHPSAESRHAVCIMPWSLTPWCESCPRVWLLGVYHTMESITKYCFDPKFHKCYFSVMPEDIFMKIIRTRIVQEICFTSEVFQKWSQKALQIQKHQKRTYLN